MRPLTLAVVALALSGLSSDGQPQGDGKPPPTPGPGPEAMLPPVALIGDSLAVGLERPLRAELAPRGLQFRASARGGTNAGQWLARGWLVAVLARHPRTVLISLGTNDSAVPGSTTARLFADRVIAIAEQVRRAGAVPVFLEPPPMPWSLEAVRAALRATGERVVAPPPNLPRARDKVHCTPAGYAEWAAAIAKELWP